MKHFINLFVILVLVGFAIGIALCIMITHHGEWGVLFLPLIIMIAFWGDHLSKTYQ
jgi:hypothetical protein